MDPASALGVAAAATQFAEQVLIISDGLYQFFKNVKNAPKLSRELRKEALLLSDTLENLRSVFSSHHSSTLPKSRLLPELLQGFEEMMKEMVAKVEIKEGEISRKRLTWPFTQKENEKYLTKLERFKSSFQLALQTLQSYKLPGRVLIASSKLDHIEFLARRIDYTVQHSYQLNMGIYFSFPGLRVQMPRNNKHRVFHFRVIGNSFILEKRLHILNWIYPHELNQRHKEFAQVRNKGSGDWFLRSALYKVWLNRDSESPVLFCHGMRMTCQINQANVIRSRIREVCHSVSCFF